ncbi:MAG: response regulator [Candidatus Zixiibacteriota bacterium]|nr:MAG: response regulator [candidate division Zixibacteria bacterium]
MATKRILIVDDNPNMSALLSDMLEVFDYQSERASDGAEALAKLDKNKYAMIITDMRMPNMSGLELLEAVKERYPKLPVVLVSGYSIATIESHHVKADGILGKPLMMADVERLLNSLL